MMGEKIKGLVTVIMPAYNAEKYISEAIASVLAQDYTELELIVIDDGSSDATCRIVREFAERDRRVRLEVNETNSGVAVSRNRGMDMARGEFIALLDSDDAWYPEKLSKQIAALREQGADLACTSYELMNEAGRRDGRLHSVTEKIEFDDMLANNLIGCSTVMMTGRCVEYRFTTDYFHEDYALWLQMLSDGCVAVGVTDTLVSYRVMAGSKAGNKVKSALHRWQIYRGYLGFPFGKSLGYLTRYATAGLNKYYLRKK